MAMLATGVGLVLLVPLIAMRFTPEVMWSLADFAAAAVLLFCAGLTFVVIPQIAPKLRLPIAALVLAVLVLMWAELAVGVLGSPWAGS